MFWTDVWCSDCSLRDWFPGLYDLEVNEEAIVFSYLAGLSEGEGRHWNPQFSRAFAGFGVTIYFFFLGVLYVSSGQDQVVWLPSKKGVFEVRP